MLGSLAAGATAAAAADDDFFPSLQYFLYVYDRNQKERGFLDRPACCVQDGTLYNTHAACIFI